MAGRFSSSRKPFMKPPPRRPSPKFTHGDHVVLIEDHEEEENQENEREQEENKYFRLTSIRTLVWINFGLIILLIFSFLLYILTRPITFSPSSSLKKEEDQKEEVHRVYFNLIPDANSQGKWTLVSLKRYGFNTESILYLNVCCTKEGAFFCDPNWASFRGHDAQIKIKHPDMVGSACRLIWLD